MAATLVPTDAEVSIMFDEYLRDVLKDIPDLSPELQLSMNDAFRAGINAMCLRNMPLDKRPERVS